MEILFLIMATRQLDLLTYIDYALIIDLTDKFNLNCSGFGE